MKKLRVPIRFIDAFDEYPQVQLVNDEIILAGYSVGVKWDESYIPTTYYIECGYDNFICNFELTENGIVTSMDDYRIPFKTLSEMFAFVMARNANKEIQVYLIEEDYD